jgi:Translationally controlled tumour protein
MPSTTTSRWCSTSRTASGSPRRASTRRPTWATSRVRFSSVEVSPLTKAGYMKNIKKKLEENGSSPEEVKAFEAGAGAFAKKIIANFKDYEFLIGESMDPDGMVLLLNYREDGITPYVTVWKHGLTEMKV